jgi:hypothetical protein
MVKEYLKYQERALIILEPKLIRAAGIKTKCKDMEFINMHVEQVIKANGKIINIMEKVCMNSQMAPYMKESGSIIK